MTMTTRDPGRHWRFVLLTALGLLMPALASAGQSINAGSNSNSGKPTKNPPTVAVTAPANGSTIVVKSLPQTIAVSATAVPPAGDKVVNVKFSAGALDLGTQNKPISGNTYGASWVVTGPGTYTVKAAAQDAGGAGASASATVTVLLDPPPVVSLTSPSNHAVFVAPGTIPLGSTATAAIGSISRVNFYAGSTLIGSGVLNSGIYQGTWSGVPSGTYSLTAVATDSYGDSGTSSAITVTVDAAPTVVLTSPSGGTFNAGATIPLSANASDSDGSIASVAFYAGTTLIATSTSTSSPYVASWSSVPAGSYSVTAVATDNLGISTTSAAYTLSVSSAAPGSEPLIQPGNLVYQGAFRVPDGTFGSSPLATFEYGGTALAFNASHNSLFLVGHDSGQLVAEIGIPPLVNSTNISDLNTATVLQPFADPTGGTLATVNPGGTIKIGGLLPYNDRLYLTAFDYYDGVNTQVRSHFITDPNFSLTNVNGPYQVGEPGFCLTSNQLCAGFVDGYMTNIPLDWQAALGGPVLSGQCCIPVIGRTSSGPAAVTIDPGQLGLTAPLPVTPQVFYPLAYPTLGTFYTDSAYFNGSSEVKGLVFPSGTRSLLFFGRHGLGPFCYGEGTSDPTLAGLATPDGSIYCYDPTSIYKGTHGYPYAYYVWAYDASQLAGVAGGNPWNPTPYAVWSLTLPFGIADAHILGATYDAASGRIFLSEAKGDVNALPVIHVFSVNVP